MVKGIDIFRLYLALTPSDRFKLPIQIRRDMENFLKCLPAESKDWNAINAAIGGTGLPEVAEVLTQMKAIFGLYN